MLVFGVGVNDADYSVKIRKGNVVIFKCPFYSRWINMLTRCYRQDYRDKFPSYIGCSVCPEWLLFTNFKLWMEKQDWKGKQLDKDLLIEGNKEYSPEACVFIDNFTNSLFTNCYKNTGVHLSGNKHVAQCRKNKATIYLGRFNDRYSALKEYRKFKYQIIIDTANRQSDERVKAVLIFKAKQLIKVVTNGRI